MTTFRTLLAIWNSDPDLRMEHWDVKTAFVNAPINEDYCHLSAGYGEEGFVIKLLKALYGTKQAAHAWQMYLRKILVLLVAKCTPRTNAFTCSEKAKRGVTFPHMLMTCSRCSIVKVNH